MRESLFETLVGLAVVAVAGFFLVFSLSQSSSAATGDSYVVGAEFPRADGITPGTDVRMAGVKVGTVTAVGYNPKTFKADVKLTVQKNVVIPTDSSIQVQADGLLGGSYLHIEPGGEAEDIVSDGTGQFQFSRGSVDILRLLIDAVAGAAGGEQSGGAEQEAAQ